MAAKYSKEFLIDAFVYRYRCLTIEQMLKQEELASKFYDTVDQATFRKYCCLDADALNNYKLGL